MAREVLNPNFFKKKPTTAEGESAQNRPLQPAEKPPVREQAAAARPRPAAPEVQKPVEKENVRIRLGHRTAVAVQEACAALKEAQQPKLADAVAKAAAEFSRDRFVVAVVGEVGRGKSTLVNALAGQSLLPVGDLPTTAMLTRVRNHESDAIVVFDIQGRRQQTLPLKDSSWDELVADPFGDQDPKGSVLVQKKSPWLGKWSLELLDTPGLGSPEGDRARILAGALNSADAAIVTVSATLPLSMSEKENILRPIFARKLPFAMLVITKLDQLPPDRRGDMVEYITGKLKQWKMEIPVFIASDVKMPDDRYDAVRGEERIRRQIQSWIRSDKRVARTEICTAVKVSSVLNLGIRRLEEKNRGVDAANNQRLAQIEEKKNKLQSARKTWNRLRQDMQHRQEECCQKLEARVKELSDALTERLQYEAAHCASPQKWWTEDYPYRVKVELGNLASTANEYAARIMNEDLAWFNRTLDKCFKTYVIAEREQVLDKDRLQSMQAGQSVEMQSLEGKRSAAKLAVTAISIAGSIALSGAGLAVLSSMGVNAGGNMLADYIFKDKIDKQRLVIKDAIAGEIPQLINQSMAQSRDKVEQVYQGILSEAVSKEEQWLKEQEAAIDAAFKPQNESENPLAARLARLQRAKARLDGIAAGVPATESDL